MFTFFPPVLLPEEEGNGKCVGEERAEDGSCECVYVQGHAKKSFGNGSFMYLEGSAVETEEA